MHCHPRAALLLCCAAALLGSSLSAAAAAAAAGGGAMVAVPAAPSPVPSPPSPGAVDFGAQLVAGADAAAEETVDLSVGDPKEMESLLHWAIEHSDPDKLREAAAESKEDAVKQFVERKQRVEELSNIVSQLPTEAQQMKELVALVADANASTADKAAALAELQVLVEPIDNANDLKVLGGLLPLVACLAEDQPGELQEGAAFVLGTAASNNAQMTAALLEAAPDVLQQLLQLASSSRHEGAAVKAVYALAALVRAPLPAGRALFYRTGGLGRLQALASPSSGAPRRAKAKAVTLVADLIELTASGDDDSVETWGEAAMAQFAAAAVAMLQDAEGQLDGQEKALAAMRTLLLRRGEAGMAALADEGAEAALREALTQLDLLVEGMDSDAAAAGAAGGKEGSKAGGSSSEEQEAADLHMYAQYVAGLCADVLHHLAIHHEEL